MADIERSRNQNFDKRFMKTNCWLVLGTMLATTAVAQVKTNALPEIPAPATVVTPAPTSVATPVAPPVKKEAAKPKKKAVKKIIEPTVALTAGAATVVSDNLNVRGQAGLKGEAITRLKKGDTVTVLAQINLDKHAADEPAQWAKISLPSGIKVWVNSRFVDATNKVVTARKLNLRAGPGENYSVLGVLEKGAAITEVSTKGDWMQIEAPANAFAFVAAIYLKQEAAPVVEPTPPKVVEPPVTPPPPVTTNTVPEAPPVVPTPPAPVVENPVVPPVVDTNPPPPRIVSHEGFVRPSVSPVAPTYYELYDKETGNAINYLFTSNTNLNLARYNGFQIVVTGEEGLAARWKDTPVLTIQSLSVLSTNKPVVQRVNSPRSSSNTPRASQRH
jgi:uncharacterized protein YgiM (DUF1202 family)